MEEFFSSFLRRSGMPASAGLSCYSCMSEISIKSCCIVQVHCLLDYSRHD